MTITTIGAELEVYRPSDNLDADPRRAIPGADVEALEFNERIGWQKDTGRIEIRNDNGRHDETISSGDLVRFVADLGTPEFKQIDAWGDSEWGEFVWPGDRLVWAAMARDADGNPDGPQRETLTRQAEDFALGVMVKRDVYESFEGWTPAAMIQRCFDVYTPELTVSIDSRGRLDQEATAAFDGESLYDTIDEIASRADAVVRSHGSHVHVEPFSLSEPQFSATPAHDFGLVDWSTDDDDLANYYRIDGGKEDTLDHATTFTETDGFRTVTPENPIHFQLTTELSELSKLALYTRTRGDSPTVTIAIQNGDRSGPVAPDDASKNLARNQQDGNFISPDGWTEFLMPEPSGTVRANPWIIVTTDDGQVDLATTPDNRIAREVYYPRPVATLRQDSRSQRHYRRRDDRVSIDGANLADARERGAAALRRNSQPDMLLELNAESHRMHTLRPGQLIEVAEIREFLRGEYLLIERSDEFENHDIDTELTLQRVGSI